MVMTSARKVWTGHRTGRPIRVVSRGHLTGRRTIYGCYTVQGVSRLMGEAASGESENPLQKLRPWNPVEQEHRAPPSRLYFVSEYLPSLALLSLSCAVFVRDYFRFSCGLLVLMLFLYQSTP